MFTGYDRRAQAHVAKRVKIFQPATLHRAIMTARIYLLNLSLTGAMADAEAPPATGTLIAVATATEHVAARIVWTRGRKFGLAFARPLSPAQAEAMIAPTCAMTA